MQIRLWWASLGAAILLTTPGQAELQITEMMANPLLDDSAMWEWIEVRNAGSASIDLNGYIVNKLAFDQEDAIVVSTAATATIAAGGLAVLYDGAADGADDPLFRAAWGVDASMRLISIPNLPALSNSGANRNIGFWADQNQYMKDWVDDGDVGFDVGGFDNAAFGIDYAADGFPSVGSGQSSAWTGQGDYRDGAQWARSEEGIGGAVLSSQVAGPTSPINNTDDVGSPGVVPMVGPTAPGLLVTEIMYNPASADSAWEWIEIFNNTGSAIDFGAAPFYLDDVAGGDLDAPNVSTGVVAHGETAVLFDGDAISPQNFSDAWDPEGGSSLNVIEVSRWPSLNNGGDEIGLWDGLDAYLDDSAGDERATASAEASIAYGSGGDPPAWPVDDGAGSIFLADLGSDASVGANWQLSLAGTGDAHAAVQALESVEAHPGGEVGSPGVFGDVPPPAAADFNADQRVDRADLLVWETAFGLAATAATGDATGDDLATGDDMLAWQRQYSGAANALIVPEPSGAILALLLAAPLMVASTYAPPRRTV